MTTAVRELRTFRIYILIAVPVILFNLVVVFGLNVLLQDDAGRYYRIVNGLFPFKFWKEGLFLCSLTEWISWTLMVISPQLIRVIYVVFLMVPLSCVIYNLFRKLGFPTETAYVAAILPNILPAQNLVPAFINGSYILLGLLVIMGCFFKSFAYLEIEDRKNRRMLFYAVLCFLISTQLMDQAVFLFPVLLLAVLGYRKLTRKHFSLALSLTLAVSYKLIWVLLAPRGTAKITPLQGSIMLSRLKNYFFAMLPFPDLLEPYRDIVLIIIIVVMITGLILSLRDPDNTFIRPLSFSHLTYRQFVFYIYGFLLVWTIGNIFAFITMSRFETVRYGYIAAYGLNALLLVSLYSILKRIFKAKSLLINTTFIIIIFISGLSRTIELKSYYDRLNKNQFQIQKKLSSLNLPMNSQIVIYLKNGENYWGFWNTSSGHLKYILKRKDIDGLIGSKTKVPYFDFHDPFNPNCRGFGTDDLMNGLSLNRPLFLFVENKSGFRQYGYALQWQGKTPEAPWTIHKVSQFTGTILPFASGIGLEDYVLKIKELGRSGIRQSDILWGGPTKEDQ
jgi:hypothetical protein